MQIGTQLSSSMDLKFTVPPDPVLGRILFLIYINDLLFSVNRSIGQSANDHLLKTKLIFITKHRIVRQNSLVIDVDNFSSLESQSIICIHHTITFASIKLFVKSSSL